MKHLKTQESKSASDKLTMSLDKFLPTVVICGPCGCGKSTLVAEIFDTISSVVTVSYKGCSIDEFASAIFESLELPCPDSMTPATFLKAVLKEIRNRWHQRPTVIVEVDKRFDRAHLENLLLYCLQGTG